MLLAKELPEESGDTGLFVNENFTTHIFDIPENESRQILAELYAHSVKPEFIYRHQWQPHDMLFWDNRALIHLAAGCPSHLRRRMHRTTIQGDRSQSNKPSQPFTQQFGASLL